MMSWTILRCASLFLLLICHCEGSEKKGYAIAFRKHICGDFAAFGQMNWWYDWRTQPFAYVDNPPNCTGLTAHDATHKAMVWGWYPKTKDKVVLPSATVLLGFNEPNHKNQANLTPEQAANAWPTLQNMSNGLPLGSPAAAPCGGVNCLQNTFDWFDQFFGNCTGCRVDFLATHLYWCNAQNVINRLQELYNRYNRPIWLTEFACPSTNPTQVMNYMQAVLPMLESAAYVERYAWYASRIVGGTYVKDTASLLQANSPELTDLGQYYVNYNP